MFQQHLVPFSSRNYRLFFGGQVVSLMGSWMTQTAIVWLVYQLTHSAAWLGVVATPTVEYSQLILPFVISGVGMGLFFAPVANVVLSAVRPQEEGQASGANNAIREVGGVFGVAVLASVFTAFGGSYASPQAFTDGMKPAILIGAVFVAFGSAASFAIPKLRRMADPALEPEAFPIGDAEPEQVLAS